MAVAFHPGQTLTEADLKIIIRDSSGTPIDPSYIRYSLFDVTTGIEVLIGAPDRIPATSGVGIYYVDATVPLDSNIGDWLVRWNFRETPTSPLVEVVQQFNIVKECTTISITGSDVGDLMLRRLRIMLRDNNPDRNYRFRPPSHEKFLQSQSQVFGYVWEDEELYEYILMSIDWFNAAPPATGITLFSMPDRWRTVILLGAGFFACAALALNWINDEYSVAGKEKVDIKDDDGNMYSVSMEELYKIIYQDKLEKIENEVKKEYAAALKEIGETDGIYKSNLQSPSSWLNEIGVQLESTDNIESSFYTGNLYVKGIDTETGEVTWNRIKDIYLHHTQYKDAFEIITETASVQVTEDHSLFLYEGNVPVRAKDLKPGDFIVGVTGDDRSKHKIVSVKEIDPLGRSYDLSVPKVENFVLSSGLLAHNSYSISGVSLDLEKSSKYESMKGNFESQFSAAKEEAKRTIKIVKGLKQPRYGVGISSALGPYSRPGVQSRRNWVSGGRGGWA